ncbi:MAG: glycosyltransferase [Solirubrobacterales bacterium]
MPGVTRPFLRDVAAREARRAVRRAVDRIGMPVGMIVVASLNDMLDVVPCEASVFYGTDDYVAGARLMGTDPAWLQRSTERQLDLADVVIATSHVLAERWSGHRDDIHVLPNGCDFDRLATADRAPPPDDVDLPGRSPGSWATCRSGSTSGCSTRSPRPGRRSCSSARDSRRSRSPGSRRSSRGPTCSGWAPSTSPSCPPTCGSSTSDSRPTRNRRSIAQDFPLKTLDYLAAGRPVVASDLPAHHWLDTGQVHIARDPEEFARATSALLSSPRSPQTVCECHRVAARNSWEARASELLELVEAPVSAGSAAP